MTLRYKIGNIIDAPENVLVNAVNCVGVMGGGVALAFKNAFPLVFGMYAQDCAAGLFRPGDVEVYPTTDGRLIFCAATKDDWRRPSQIHWIIRCLDGIVGTAEAMLPYPSGVALPKLGCGLGGLAWGNILPAYETLLGASPIDFVVYDLP